MKKPEPIEPTLKQPEVSVATDVVAKELGIQPANPAYEIGLLELSQGKGEFLFYSIHRLRAMTGDALISHLNRFLSGKWKADIRKRSMSRSYDYEIRVGATPDMLQRLISGDRNSNVEIRHVELDPKSLVLTWKICMGSEIISRETLTVEDDETMSGMNSEGCILKYKRRSLFKAIS